MLLAAGRLASAALSTLLGVGLVVTAVPVSTAGAAVRGPDVARYQHPHGHAIKWSSVRADGVQFAFVKATEGTDYTNPYFAGDFAALGSLKMVRGAYHYARPRAGAANAVAQARHFVAVTGNLRAAGDLPPVLDLERNGGLKAAALIKWTRAYLNEVTRLTGRAAMIYTYPAFWRSSMKNTTAFKGSRLWIATWGPKAKLVGGWTKYTFWQYTSKARLDGISGPVDMSVFNGSTAALNALANGQAAAPKKYLPRITAALSKKTVRVGSSVTVKGSTSRTLAGQKLYRQGYWSGHWHTWKTTKVSSKGTYKFTIRPTVKAVNTYRIYVKSTGKHEAASSRWFKLRAK